MKTNFLYALRNIKNNPVNAIITVLGLSVAIACCLIIYFYVSQEFNYNSFHENSDRIYRINYDIKYIDFEGVDVRLRPEMCDLLKKEVPQIEKCAEYRHAFQQVLKHRENYFDVDASYASEDFFDMFSFKFIAGDQFNVFENPNEVVITRELADRLLENQNYESLIGERIEFPIAYSNDVFQIVGIIEDIPNNSSINFDAILSGESGTNFGGCDNYFGYTSIFYLLKEKANADDTEKTVNRIVTDYNQDRVNEMKKRNQLKNTQDAFRPFVLSLNDVYLRGDIWNCFEGSVEKRNFIILSSIGLLILIIACSNYTILSLGQYLKKISDVGIRRAMGASSNHIFTIFFSESIILTVTAFLLGGILSGLFVPVFGNLAQTEIYTELINFQNVIVFGLLLFIAIVLFISIIPVLVFSKVSIQQIAGKKISVGSKTRLSQVFVSVQYSLSIILIIVTLFIVRQSNYMKERSLGLNTNNIIDIRIRRVDSEKRSVLKTLLSEHPGVIDLTLASRNFMNGSSNDYVNKGNGEQVNVFRFKVDEDYISTLGLNLIQGKNFTAGNIKPNDRSMIVNEKFIEALGIEDEPIGQTYTMFGTSFTIIGVVADYHYFDMHSPIWPAMLNTRTNFGNDYSNILLRFHPAQLPEVIKHIKKCYDEVAPGKTFDYSFWDEQLKERYETEDRWSKIIGYASAIAIIIASLGLFGLTILLVNQQIKEIGIRKVNGARASEVLLTINKAFIGWLFGSIIIAIPVAYYIVEKWLSNFSYKIDVSWWLFILAGCMALAVAFLTVSWQSWKAANKNPVEALRYE